MCHFWNNMQISGYGSLLRVIMNNVVYKVVSCFLLWFAVSRVNDSFFPHKSCSAALSLEWHIVIDWLTENIFYERFSKKCSVCLSKMNQSLDLYFWISLHILWWIIRDRKKEFLISFYDFDVTLLWGSQNVSSESLIKS